MRCVLSDQVDLLAHSDPDALGRLVDQVLEPTFVVDAQGLVVFANRGVEELLGRSVAEMVDEPPPFPASASHVSLTNAQGQPVETRLKRRPLGWKGGQATAITLQILDKDGDLQSLTQELERANQRAREADERFRRYYLQAPPELERLIQAEDRANEAETQAREAKVLLAQAQERSGQAEREAESARRQAEDAKQKAFEANDRFRRLYEKSGPAVAELEQLQKEFDDNRQALQLARDKVASLKEAMASKEQTITATEQAKSELEARLVQLESSAIKPDELEAEREKGTQLQAQVEALNAKVQAYQSNEAKIREQFSQLRDRLARTQEIATDKIQQAKAQFQTEYDKVQAQLRSTREQAEKLYHSEADARQKVAQLQNQIALAPSQADLDRALDKVSQLQFELDQTQGQTPNPQALEQTQSRLAELEAELASRPDPAEVEQLRSELELSKNALADYQSQTEQGPPAQELELLQSALAELENQLSERPLAEELHRIISELERTREAASSVSSETDSLLAELQSQLAQRPTQDEVDQLRGELEMAHGVISELEIQLSDRGAEVGDQRELEQTRAALAELETQLAERPGLENLQQLQAELDQARDTISTLEIQVGEKADEGELERLKGELEMALGTISDLEVQLGEPASPPQEVEELRAQLSQAQATIDQLQSQPDPSLAEEVSHLKAELERSHQTVTDLEEQLGQAADSFELEALRADNQSLREQMSAQATSSLELEQARSQIVQLQQELDQRQQALAGNEEELERRLEEAQQLLDEQAKDLSEAQFAREEWEQKAREAMEQTASQELETELSQSRQRIQELESQVFELLGLEETVSSLKREASELQSANLQLQTALEEARAQASQATEIDPHLASQLEQSRARVQELEQELMTASSLRQQLHDTETRLRELEVAPQPDPDLAEELAQAQARISQLEERLLATGTLEQRLQESQARIQELEHQLDSSQAPNEALERIRHLEDKLLASSQLEQELQAAQARIAQLEDSPSVGPELEQARSRIAELERENSSLRHGGEGAETDQLRRELEDARARLNRLRDQALSAETTTLDLDQQRGHLEAKLEARTEDVGALEAELGSVKAALQDTKQKATILEEKMSEFENQARQAKARVHEYEAQLHQLSAALNEAKSTPTTDHETARLAFEDTLTQLPNINILNRYLDMTTKRVAAKEGSLAVLVVDIDRFRVANDTLGHKAGDELLRQVGQRLNSLVERPDVLGRRGEDEFLIVVFVETPDNASAAPTNHTPAANKARGLAGKLMGCLRQPFVIEGQSIHLTATIGISLFPGDANSAATLVEHADSAMYNAKDAGRARTQFYTYDLHQNQEAKLKLVSELHQGIARNEFLLYYQPIIDLNKGRIEGIEALLRWNHPVRGLLEPKDFLQAAEDSALIITIGDWVIDEACRLIGQFRGKSFVSVNVSPRQLLQSNFSRRFMKAIERSRIRADRVVVEVSETEGAFQNQRVLEVLRELAQWNVGISLDDYGTGDSSVRTLKESNIRFLKIDELFVGGCPHDAPCMAITRGAIGLAQGLGTLSLAEGVETKEQLRALKQFGCHYAQGFFFSEPVPHQAVPALMKRSWKF